MFLNSNFSDQKNNLKVGAEPQYSYNYKRVTAAPRTPDRSDTVHLYTE